MPSLLELQERFATALDGADASFARGMDVYRHAIAANYRRALAATYPVVRSLLGAASFERAVDGFVEAHPPACGDLNIYGAEFGRFVERGQLTGQRDFLAGMARLEWAVDESMRAADVASSPSAVIADLTVLSDEAVDQARLRLHPSCRMVAAAGGVYETWRSYQAADASPAPSPAKGAMSEFLLVRRHGGRALVERIEAGEFAWLAALRSGDAFADALAEALERDAAFDLEQALVARMHDGTICGVELAGYNPRHG